MSEKNVVVVIDGETRRKLAEIFETLEKEERALRELRKNIVK